VFPLGLMGTSMSALATETRKITRARPSALKNEEILERESKKMIS
jgi:hypothetical protein